MDFFRRLVETFNRNCSERWRTNRWFVHHDNAPAHRSVLVIQFLAKKNVTTLYYSHNPYYPDIPPADFYLFPPVKSELQERFFCDATDITKFLKEELKRILQYDFHESLQRIYRSW